MSTDAVSEMDADFSGLDIDRHRTPPVYYTDSGWVFVGSGRQHAVVLRISRPAKPVVAPGRAAPVVIHRGAIRAIHKVFHTTVLAFMKSVTR